MIHLIRASLRFCSWKDRTAITKALRPIYTAPTLEAAEEQWTPSSSTGATELLRLAARNIGDM